MADKTFLASFGYDPGMHPLSGDERSRIAEHMRAELGSKSFSDDDFTDMEKALDATEGAFIHFRDHAPDPKDLKKQCDAIHRAARELYKLLRPSMIEHKADLRSPPIERTIKDYAVAKEAANRVISRLQFPKGLEPNQLDELEEIARHRKQLEELEAFEEMLWRVGGAAEIEAAEVAAEIEKTAIEDRGADGKPWEIISESGTRHYYYLVTGLRPIAGRHGWQLKYTRVTDTSAEPGKNTSPIAKLAMALADMKLPEKARPTIHALIRVMNRESGLPRNRMPD